MHASKKALKSLDRLTRRSDFLLARDQGKSWVSKGFILQVRDNGHYGRRFGVTVTRKTASLAVDRNRIKRRLRSLAADILPLNSKDNMDYVLIGRSEGAKRLYPDLQNDLIWCLNKLGVAISHD